LGANAVLGQVNCHINSLLNPRAIDMYQELIKAKLSNLGTVQKSVSCNPTGNFMETVRMCHEK
jgi:hypothetical protein